MVLTGISNRCNNVNCSVLIGHLQHFPTVSNCARNQSENDQCSNRRTYSYASTMNVCADWVLSTLS